MKTVARRLYNSFLRPTRCALASVVTVDRKQASSHSISTLSFSLLSPHTMAPTGAKSSLIEQQ
jgi:hypothetical protein